MNMDKKTLKKKLITILTTATFVLLATILHLMKENRILYDSPAISILMLVATAVYVFGSCMLQTFGKFTASLVLGVVVFFIICTCLFYSTTIIDYIIFFVCMGMVIRKSNKTCDCLEDCKRPLKDKRMQK